MDESMEYLIEIYIGGLKLEGTVRATKEQLKTLPSEVGKATIYARPISHDCVKL